MRGAEPVEKEQISLFMHACAKQGPTVPFSQLLQFVGLVSQQPSMGFTHCLCRQPKPSHCQPTSVFLAHAEAYRSSDVVSRFGAASRRAPFRAPLRLGLEEGDK